MITVCPGWSSATHRAPIVLKAEDHTSAGTSHGMCSACSAAMNSELDKRVNR